jgi:hypothetical protein
MKNEAVPILAVSDVEAQPPSAQGAKNSLVQEQHVLITTSISEAAAASSGWTAPKLIRWLEMGFQFKDPTTGKMLPEATGWAMDSAARGPLNQVGGYVGTSILLLATTQAGCVDCKVLGGVRPASLLTLSSVVVGVCGALLMPFFGAIVDLTPHRKLVGAVSGAMTVLFTGVLIGISVEKNNWLFILIVDALQRFFLLVHSTAVLAYLPDLTLDYSVLPAYTAHFNIRQFVFQFTFVGFLILCAGLRPKPINKLYGSTQTARDAAGLAFGYGVLLVGYSWTFCFRKRPALSKVPEGSNLVTTACRQVMKTTGTIWQNHRALKWFMLSLLFSPEAGAGVAMSILVTFLVTVMAFTGLDLAKTALIIMAANPFGSYFSTWMCKRVNPLNSYRIGLFCLGVSIGVSAAIVSRPEQRAAVYGFACAWGFLMGWVRIHVL